MQVKEGPTAEDPNRARAEATSVAERKQRYREIGHELRRMFDDVVNEPVPEDLLTLVKKLDGKTGGGGSEPKS